MSERTGMGRGAKIAGGIGLGVAALGLCAVGVGTLLWNRATSRLMDAVAESGSAAAPAASGGGVGVAPGAASEGAPSAPWGASAASAASGAAWLTTGASRGVPRPVERFLSRSIPPGAPDIHLVRLAQRGEFRVGAGEDSWRPFEATELLRADPPAFAWDARIRMFPLLTVRVRDGYLAGRGSMAARVAGVVPVMDAEPSSALDAGALYRYLAEAPWLPTRLRPDGRLSWTAIDDSTAQATLTDGRTRVTVRFRFDGDGDIVETYAPARPREVDGAYVEAPWIGRFGEHRQVGGYRIPTVGAVAWIEPDGTELEYWRGRIAAAAFTTVP